VSRRCHPAALALAGTSTAEQLRAEPLARRRRRRSVLVPGPSAPRQESSRPPCGETRWCPDSSAPSTNAPRVVGPSSQLSRDSEPPNNQTTNGFCSPHDPRTRSALLAPRLYQTGKTSREQTVTRVSSRSPSDEVFIAQLDARTYVACTTTDFVWISSAKLDGGLVRPHRLWSTRRGAMHSPSGSLLTTRVNMFLLTGEALTITSQTLSSYSSAFDRFEGPSTCVGRPTLVVRTESQRRFGFSKPS
jgi:hypothetical protein